MLLYLMSFVIEVVFDVWCDDFVIFFVIMEVEGEKVFCVGGDIVSIYY